MEAVKFQNEIIMSGEDLLNEVKEWNTLKKENEIKAAEPGLSHSAIIDTIYLDFDDEASPLNAIIEGRETVQLLKAYGIESRIYWSGKKGIALYIDFEPFDIQPVNIKGVVSSFDTYVQKKFVVNQTAENTLKHLCDSTRDGQSRISRLPNTLHKSSGLYCIPLLESDLWQPDPLAYLRELSKKPRSDINLELIIQCNVVLNTSIMHSLLISLEKYIIKSREVGEYAKKIVDAQKPKFSNSGTWRKCAGVKHAEENIQVMPGREPTADGLVLAYMMWGHYPIEQTKEEIKVWLATKCHPPRDFDLIEERIDKFYAAYAAGKPKAGDPNKIEGIYSPCTFLTKYKHCDSAFCDYKLNKMTGWC